MNLTSLNILDEYRSDKENIIDSFYIPCLMHCNVYKRSVGYFTSRSLSLIAKGIIQLLRNGGKMQLIASPYLTEEDVEAIERGYKTRDDVIKDAVLRQLDNVEEDIVKHRLSFLAKLISDNRLEIKIAVLTGKIDRGIYHEKLGLFQDNLGNTVAFSGSANETEGGLQVNFEQIDAFCSWKSGDHDRVQNKASNFEELWTNTTKKLDVISFTDALENSLIQYNSYYKEYDPESGVAEQAATYEAAVNNKEPNIPDYVTLREYQKDAIKSWFKHDGSGMFEMATGTGKTITALSTAVLWYKTTKELCIIIVCPYSHLVNQWSDEARKFNLFPILAYESRLKWEDELNHNILSYNISNKKSFSVITTNKTFTSEVFQECIGKISRPAMLIIDEAHHIGAEESIKNLPDHIRYRLALSATPERWMDPLGTADIKTYFSPGVIFTFGLKEAIGEFLTEYYYYPHLVELTEDETHIYHDLSKKIARLSKFGKSNVEIEHSTELALRSLLIKRARLIGRARNKTILLLNLMKEKKDSKHNIFYCGDEKVDGVRQLEEVMRMLGQDLEMKVHPFTSDETSEERKKLLRDFEQGEIQGLVAIRCLDEGVDVPATQTAYILASSTNPREFIQRRGRILRKHPGKTYAYIHDFLVVPRDLGDVQNIDSSIFNTERALMKKELSRSTEFADLAFNGAEARSMLLDVKTKYNLLHI